MHLIQPLGFELDDKKMRRAGLDYHEHAGISVYENWLDFLQKRDQEQPRGRIYGISTKGARSYHEVAFEAGDYLLFGPETRGLPDPIREELGPDCLLRIPMLADSRSLNLANAAAVVVYEAWRQLGFVDGL